MPSAHRGIAIAVLWTLLLCWGVANSQSSAWAQGDAAATATSGTNADAAPISRPESFFGWMIRSSGLVGYLILLLGLVMLGLLYAHLIQLRREAFIPPTLAEQFERLLDDKNYQAAYEMAQSSDSFLGRVLAAGLARVPRGYDDALLGMREAGEQETLRLEQSVGYHGLIASVAPMLGLLGTVQGLALSLYSLSGASAAMRSPEFAQGVATAAVSTLESLVVAIPALLCYTLFRNRLARFVMESGFLAEELMKRFRGAARPAAVVTRSAPSTIGAGQPG